MRDDTDYIDIDLIAGARPNFIKLAAIVRGLLALRDRNPDAQPPHFRIIHTGQHHDQRMSGHFFEQLGIPEPDITFSVGSGTHAKTTAAIMCAYEDLILSNPPRICLVVGDVNSTLAAALAAAKVGVPIAHVEAGLRSGDKRMPEEINRMATDAISDYYFTTEKSGTENLVREGVSSERIYFVGNTMIDTLLAFRKGFRPAGVWNSYKLRPRGYILLTLHRPGNVDSPNHFKTLMEKILASANGIPIVFPTHPRTASKLKLQGAESWPILFTEPLPYLEFGHLMANALAVITDSGGVTEETTVLGVPCLTVRDNTERPATVSEGTNELVMSDARLIPACIQRILNGSWKAAKIPEGWDGHAGDRIANRLVKILLALA
jgi:UDP-N-acetylglucosamine 2-epimerase (non-hydrolysing)